MKRFQILDFSKAVYLMSATNNIVQELSQALPNDLRLRILAN